MIGPKDLHIPIIYGAAKPLNTKGKIAVTPGAAYMANYLRHHKASIMAIAPLTDVASLLSNFPQVRNNIIHIYIEAGRKSPEPFTVGPNKIAVPDLNFVKDPRAAKIILNSDVDVTILPFNGIRHVRLNPKDFQKIANHNTPASKWLAKTLYPWYEFWYKRYREKSIHPWDAVIAYYMVHPQGFQCESLASKVVKINRSQQFLKKYPYMKNETSALIFAKNFPGKKQLYCGQIDKSTVPIIKDWIIKYAY